MDQENITLRYGANPHQSPARVFVRSGKLPITILNGRPGYINLLDALNAWQLVREVKAALGRPAATSFKHVSPAGAAVGLPMSPALKQAHQVEDLELSELAIAYARARGADRLSSFGDWAALSDVVDTSTARLLRREVSDGVIAPGFEDEALAMLRGKKKGNYCVIQIDPDYEPGELEQREVFGITFEQARNSAQIGPETVGTIVTGKKDLSASARIDMTIAMITLKYMQSNSVCLALNGQIIGAGAGQQSRIHCTRLAAGKADLWYLRQHPAVLGLPFKEDIGRPARDNAIDQFLLDDLPPEQELELVQSFTERPRALDREERRRWISQFQGATLASDAFIPFRDNIDRAAQSGVDYVVQPGGSLRDQGVIEACDQYGMIMMFTGLRLFHH
jgi:phosphoribosylaminoimidazolecarboxamide formyltransferase/IMP cyclohydrolase